MTKYGEHHPVVLGSAYHPTPPPLPSGSSYYSGGAGGGLTTAPSNQMVNVPISDYGSYGLPPSERRKEITVFVKPAGAPSSAYKPAAPTFPSKVEKPSTLVLSGAPAKAPQQKPTTLFEREATATALTRSLQPEGATPRFREAAPPIMLPALRAEGYAQQLRTAQVGDSLFYRTDVATAYTGVQDKAVEPTKFYYTQPTPRAGTPMRRTRTDIFQGIKQEPVRQPPSLTRVSGLEKTFALKEAAAVEAAESAATIDERFGHLALAGGYYFVGLVGQTSQLGAQSVGDVLRLEPPRAATYLFKEAELTLSDPVKAGENVFSWVKYKPHQALATGAFYATTSAVGGGVKLGLRKGASRAISYLSKYFPEEQATQTISFGYSYAAPKVPTAAGKSFAYPEGAPVFFESPKTVVRVGGQRISFNIPKLSVQEFAYPKGAPVLFGAKAPFTLKTKPAAQLVLRLKPYDITPSAYPFVKGDVLFGSAKPLPRQSFASIRLKGLSLPKKYQFVPSGLVGEPRFDLPADYQKFYGTPLKRATFKKPFVWDRFEQTHYLDSPYSLERLPKTYTTRLKLEATGALKKYRVTKPVLKVGHVSTPSVSPQPVWKGNAPAGAEWFSRSRLLLKEPAPLKLPTVSPELAKWLGRVPANAEFSGVTFVQRFPFKIAKRVKQSPHAPPLLSKFGAEVVVPEKAPAFPFKFAKRVKQSPHAPPTLSAFATRSIEVVPKPKAFPFKIAKRVKVPRGALAVPQSVTFAEPAAKPFVFKYAKRTKIPSGVQPLSAAHASPIIRIKPPKPKKPRIVRITNLRALEKAAQRTRRKAFASVFKQDVIRSPPKTTVAVTPETMRLVFGKEGVAKATRGLQSLLAEKKLLEGTTIITRKAKTPLVFKPEPTAPLPSIKKSAPKPTPPPSPTGYTQITKPKPPTPKPRAVEVNPNPQPPFKVITKRAFDTPKDFRPTSPDYSLAGLIAEAAKRKKKEEKLFAEKIEFAHGRTLTGEGERFIKDKPIPSTKFKGKTIQELREFIISREQKPSKISPAEKVSLKEKQGRVTSRASASAVLQARRKAVLPASATAFAQVLKPAQAQQRATARAQQQRQASKQARGLGEKLAVAQPLALARTPTVAQRYRQPTDIKETQLPKWFPRTDTKRVEDIYGERARQPAYSVFVRRYGKWKLVSSKLTRARAIRFGEKKATKTLAASFKIQKRGTLIGKRSEARYKPSPAFRGYKIVKGKRVPLSDEFIQKRGKRLAASGEVREIQLIKKRKASNAFRF